MKLLAVALALTPVTASGSLFDSLSALQFRNPATNATSRALPSPPHPTHRPSRSACAGAGDTVTHKPQCVLYSEIDNVTSVNKGWDVGAGVGWDLGYPYLAGEGGALETPPTGIRSAVPLGGMGTGNFELRGDGTFRQWCIESQSPGGGAKLDIGALDEAVLGLKVGPKAALLRTLPPAGLPGVAAIKYEGAVPVSKLTVADPELAQGAELALFAHGELIPWDTNGSMTPAVAFTLAVHNPSEKALDVSLLLSMPLASQPNTARLPGTRACASQGGASPLACKAACDASPSCSAWSHQQAGTCHCELITGGVPQNIFGACTDPS